MKHLVILFTFIFSGILLQAQNISLSYGSSTISNNEYIYLYGGPSVVELMVELSFANNGSENIDVCVKKTEIQLVAGTLNFFAFGGLLFPPIIYESPIQVTLFPGQLSSEFAGYYQPNNTIGESTIRYTFFDYYNPIDSICVNVIYTTEDLDPLLTGIVPNDATIPEALTVEISGSDTHFAMGTGTTVWFNQGSSTIFPESINEVSNTLLEAEIVVTNNHDPGLYDVYTSNNIDGLLSLPNAFTLYPNPNPPFLMSISPDYAFAGEMVTVTITAENTHFTQGVNFAYLYQNDHFIMDYSITVLSDETIIVEFPITSGSPNGSYDLWVNSAWDGDMYLNDVFTIYTDPDPGYLTDISPESAIIPETLTVMISGEGTHFAQATGTIVKLKQASSTIYSEYVNEINNEQLSAQFTFDNFDSPGYYDVNTINAIDGDLYLYDAFYLFPNPNPPQIVSIVPDSAKTGETLDVSISGQNTNFTQGTGTVWLNRNSYNIYPNYSSVVNDELINANFSINNYAPIGDYDVNTYNWYNGTLTLADGFHIYELLPQISYIEPTSGYQGDYISMSIHGENTHFMEGSNLDAWLFKNSNVIYPVILTPQSNSQIFVEIQIPEEAESGNWSVFVTNSIDGDLYLNNAFEVIDTITAVDEIFAKDLRIYPNPTDGKIKISLNLTETENLTVQLIDLYGNTVFSKSVEYYELNQGEFTLPTVSSGIYSLKLFTNKGSITRKVVVR